MRLTNFAYTLTTFAFEFGHRLLQLSPFMPQNDYLIPAGAGIVTTIKLRCADPRGTATLLEET